MDQQVETFCKKAVAKDLLTDGQVMILKEMSSRDISLKDFVKTAVTFGVAADNEAVIALAEEIVTSWDRMSDEDRMIIATETAIAGDKQGSTVGLDWFCFFAISEGGLTKDLCISLASEIQDLTDILSFAQAVVDHWRTSDYSKIQACVDKAMLMVQKNPRPPPIAIFTKPAAAK